MAVERVRVESLRCLRGVSVELDAGRNFVYGQNGAGKTSLLEALYLLSRGRSFRTRHGKRLIRRGADRLVTVGDVVSSAGVDRHIRVEIDQNGRSIRLDEVGVQSTAELAGVVRSDVIDPSVHGLIEGGPGERRRYVDWGVFHVEHAFLGAWRRYRRALSQRNAALKEGVGEAGWLAGWDQALVEAGESVDEARARYVARLQPVVEQVSRELLDAPLLIEHRPGWSANRGLAEALARSIDRDRRMGATQVGPHRADLSLSLDGQPISGEASRGQQKLVAAALAVAQVRVLCRNVSSGEDVPTVLLVDDPAAELDHKALARLLTVVAETGVQTIFTALSESQLPPDGNAPVFHVEQGHIEQMV